MCTNGQTKKSQQEKGMKEWYRPRKEGSKKETNKRANV